MEAPSPYLTKEEVAKERRETCRIEEEEWLFVSFVIAIKNEMWPRIVRSLTSTFDSGNSTPCEELFLGFVIGLAY